LFTARTSEKIEEWQDGSIQVFVRKRPLFKHEVDNFEFDVVTACPGVIGSLLAIYYSVR